MNIQYKTLTKDYSEYMDPLVAFYKPLYKKQFNEGTVNNSAAICIAMDEGKVVGAVRAISDLSRHTLLVDLIVDEKYRKKGIGSTLIKNMVQEMGKTTATISLATDPKDPDLENFYRKIGFKTMQGSVYMRIENN